MSDIIFYDNQATVDTVLSATTEATGHLKEKAVNYSPGSAWRTTVITVSRIVFDMGAAVNIKGVAYFGTNIEAGDTKFSLEGGVAAVTNDFTVDLDKAAKGYKEINETYRYWALEITKAAGTYIEIGKIMLFLGALTLTRNMNRGWGEKKLSVFSSVQGDYGQGSRNKKYTKQIFRNMFWEFVDEADKIIYDVNIGADPESVYYNDTHDAVYFGWFTFPVVKNRYTELWNIAGSFEEML